MMFLVIIVSFVSTNGFTLSARFPRFNSKLMAAPEKGPAKIDYDAPDGRRLEKLGVESFSQSTGPLDHEIELDEECYLGKDGELEECADFDPVVAAKKPEEIDFDAPMDRRIDQLPWDEAFSRSSGPLDHEIELDEECYLGKDGELEECADFDPVVAAKNPESP